MSAGSIFRSFGSTAISLSSSRAGARVAAEPAALGTDAVDERRQLLAVESVELGGVSAEHRLDVGVGQAAEDLDHHLSRLGPGALGMRVVRAPHDRLEPDLVAQLRLPARHRRGADADVAPEVLGGLEP